LFDDSTSFIGRAFAKSQLAIDYRSYSDEDDAAVLARLRAWDERRRLSERQAETSFIQTFFVDLWGYRDTGRAGSGGMTLFPQFPVSGEGSGGGMGYADLALGWFAEGQDDTPQVLCEFKDITARLDARQNRKGSTRSPVEQCLNYVRGARRGMVGNEPVQPWWGLVTDMNEFRLYWWDRGRAEYLRFNIRRPADLFEGPYDLLTQGSAEARFDRYLFRKLFSSDYLLSQAGEPPLLRLIRRQWIREEKLEGEFYEHYKGVRERLFNVIRTMNPDYPGTPTDLLRLSQKLLDRFIFAFYCEDMGEQMLFPPQFLRDFLKARSTEPFYDETGSEIWDFLRRLFRTMDSGGQLGQFAVPHINGGLFRADPEIENLRISNDVFAAPRQGANEAELERTKDTLLFLSGRYNYAARGEARESLSLYTLGRIFEQSITELEYRAGELEGRDSLAKLSKRKRDGVYYTPEWVVNLMVEETLTPWFAEGRAAVGGDTASWLARLRAIRIVDPACGSGAFLISAFRRLLQERQSLFVEIEGRDSSAAETSALVGELLENNIYGVDINPASVEIAKLALWLHSARADAPLSSLDHTIRCGNSLVGPDYEFSGPSAERELSEELNRFDWRAAFPEVFPEGGPGGFDVVLGNPPYVKLQNLMKVDPHVAGWLQARRGDDTYFSALTGNTDLYLPFIEKGLRLLNATGRMAYIAPSVWTVNEYGEGLRQLVRETRRLERWLDFSAHQVFPKVTTYTALQFFGAVPQPGVRMALAPRGELDANDIDWADENLLVPYDQIETNGPWLMVTGPARNLIERLRRDALRLDNEAVTSGIMVGVQTSADYIFLMDRVGDGRYLCRPKGAPAYEVPIEDEIMRPIVSGKQAKRYESPFSETYVLFPYWRTANGRMTLYSEGDLSRQFPRAFAYLQSWRQKLEEREGNSFADAQWYRFGRNQNIDKQDLRKLVVPRLVEHLKVSWDSEGAIVLDNVDVGGVLPAPGVDGEYLMAVLNGPVADFIFRLISKPFQNDFRSANKQFIAPLPVPVASPEYQADVAARARALQASGTDRRRLKQEAEARLSVLPRQDRKAQWLWPDLPTLADMTARAPAAFTARADRRQWAEEQLDEMEAARLAALQAVLGGGERLSARFEGGELRLYAGGAAVLRNIFLDEAPGRAIEAYWRWLLLDQKWGDAKAFANALRRTPSDFDTAAVRQFIERVTALEAETAAQTRGEEALNEILYRLYGLTESERLLVENARDGASNRG